MKTRVLTVETSGTRHKTRTVSSWCKQSNLIYHSMRRFFNDLFPRLGRIVIEGDFDLHTRAASKYDDRRVIHLPAFKIWWVQGRVLERIYQCQYRRPVSLFGRAPVFWAGGREFKPQPDQRPRSYATTSCKNTWDTLPYFGLIACPWSCACKPPSPLIKVASNTRPCSKLSGTIFDGGEGEETIISHRRVTSSDLK